MNYIIFVYNSPARPIATVTHYHYPLYLDHSAYHWHKAEEDEGSCENGENNCKHYSEYDTAWKLVGIPVAQAVLIVPTNGLSLWVGLLDTWVNDSFHSTNCHPFLLSIGSFWRYSHHSKCTIQTTRCDSRCKAVIACELVHHSVSVFSIHFDGSQNSYV